MITKITIRLVSILLFVFSILGCVQTSLPQSPTDTPIVLTTDTPIEVPTLTPSPTSTPEYSYLPAISAVNGTEIEKFDKYSGVVSSLAFSPNGKYLAATFENGAGIIWDISTVKYWRKWQDAPKDVFLAKGELSFNSDGNILATGGTLLELPSKRVIQELQGTVVFNPVNETLALFDWNNISIQTLDENQSILNLKEGTAGITNVTFSPDGNLLGEAINEDVNIWRVSDRTLLYSFPPINHNHPAHFNFFAYAFLIFSPDNQFIVTGTKDYEYTIRVWNLLTGELVKDIDTSNNDCIVISQDSKTIITAGYGKIVFRTFPEGDVISEIETDYYDMLPAYYLTTCITSKDGKLLAIGDSGGNINMWGIPANVP